MQKVNIKKETIELVKILLELRAVDSLSSITLKKINEGLLKKEVKVTPIFLRRLLKELYAPEIVKIGPVATKNAKTFYINEQRANKFLETIKEKGGK